MTPDQSLTAEEVAKVLAQGTQHRSACIFQLNKIRGRVAGEGTAGEQKDRALDVIDELIASIRKAPSEKLSDVFFEDVFEIVAETDNVQDIDGPAMQAISAEFTALGDRFEKTDLTPDAIRRAFRLRQPHS